MRYALLFIFVMSCGIVHAQSIPNLRLPLMVSHLSGTQKTMLARAGAPKHNGLTKVICFKRPCRGVIGWTRTQQRNKFKRYKKPGIPKLKYLKNDSIKAAERQSAPVEPTRPVETIQPVQPTEAAQKDSTIAFVFDDVLFDTNSSNLKNAFIKRLDSLSLLIMTYENYSIRIIGHTDNSGREMSNKTLSQERAEAVAKYLALTGVKQSAITAEGRGSTEPIADNTSSEGRQKNRRVQILLSFH